MPEPMRRWWIGFRVGKWGFAVFLDGHAERWIDPTDLWGVLVGRASKRL